MKPIRSAGLLRRVIGISAAALLAMSASAALANPFPKGNAAAGKKLHDPRCMSCHNSMFPDKNGTQLYSDDMFRKATNGAQLRGMIEFCNNRTQSGWFEEEIQHVGRYRNDNYYKFTK